MKKSKLLILTVLIFICLFFPFQSLAQFTRLMSFNGTATGKHPYGSLLSDGTYLYGMNNEGGTNNMGTVFKIKMDGTGYTKLLDFSSTTNGAKPSGSLITDGTFLYGMTSVGGTNDMGVIFKIRPDGTGFIKLLDFAGTLNGSFPMGSLISDGSFLYGMTYYGGTNGNGVIFKIKPDGTGYVKLWDFNGTNGMAVSGSLFSDGTYLYGMASQGGANDKGVIFKINTDGTGFSKLLDFSGTSDGSEPLGSLISDGTFLYGLTFEGGSNDGGVIFKIKPDGTGYSKLMNFSGVSTGLYPYGSPFYDGTFLFGMTKEGGTYNSGVIFKIRTDGTGFSKLFDFMGTPNGSYPQSTFISDGMFLYATTVEGGIDNWGTIFKFKTSTISVNTTAPPYSDVEIYPNPTNGKFTVSVGNSGASSFKTYNLSVVNAFGQTISEKCFTAGINFETTTWAKGMYFVELKDENGVRLETKKVVIE